MINIPWPLRLAADTIFFFGPFYFLTTHPATFYEFFREKRTLKRRTTFDNELLKSEGFMSVEETQKLYQKLGFQSDY